MKKVILATTAVLFLVSLATAGDEVMPAIKSGAKSVNFTLNGFGSFGFGGSGPAGGIGVTYFVDDGAAVRLGLQVSD